MQILIFGTEKQKELSVDEKSLLLSTQRELLSLDNMIISDVPENLTSIETLDKLSKARKDAENYINSLLEKEDDNSKE